MKVEITAEQKVKLSKIVDMSEADFKRYEQFINSDDSIFEIEKQINEIADKYDFNTGESQIDWDDPEATEFYPVKV